MVGSDDEGESVLSGGFSEPGGDPSRELLQDPRRLSTGGH